MYLKAVKINSNQAVLEDYPFSLPIIKNLLHSNQPLPFSQPITFLAGENGSGKSTLLEGIALALGMNPEGGTKNFNFSTYDSHSELHEHLTLVRQGVLPKTMFFLRAEELLQSSLRGSRLGFRCILWESNAPRTFSRRRRIVDCHESFYEKRSVFIR